MSQADERRQLLRKFVADRGGHAAVVRDFRLTQSQASYLSQLITPESVASFGETSAKNWEERLKLPSNYLVKPVFGLDRTVVNAPTIGLVDVPGVSEKNAPASVEPVSLGTTVTGVSPRNVKKAWVVGKGAGGLMPEKIWSDGDYPVGATDDFAEVASADPHCFLIKVVGLSMVPRYNPDEYALVEPGTSPELEDDVLVRLTDGQTLLKKLLSRRGGIKLGSYNDAATHFYEHDQVVWMYYVAHPVPSRKIKSRSGGNQTMDFGSW